MGDFESFVQALMAPDNDTRNEAEAQLAHLKEENADELLANLTEVSPPLPPDASRRACRPL